MAKATTTINFSDGDQVTSINLDQIIGGFSLGSDSADGSTIIINGSGQVVLGIASHANIGSGSIHEDAYQPESIPEEAFQDNSLPERAVPNDSIPGTKLTATVPWSKILPADKATQADMQSETADHFPSPAVLKYHPGISKAGGVVTMGTGAIAGGYNISGSASGGPTTRTITLAVEMANTNYRVQFSQEDTGSTGNAPSITGKTTTTFTINGGGTAYGFDVFGQLATPP